GGANPARGVPLPRDSEAREPPAGGGRDLEGTHGPAKVRRLDPRRGGRIDRGQTGVQAGTSEGRAFREQQSSIVAARPGEAQVVDDRAVVESAAAHQEWQMPASANRIQRLARETLEPGHAE